MSSISNTSAAKYKKYNVLTVTDNFGNTYLFMRTGKDRDGKDRWFNSAKCEIDNIGNGPLLDAVRVHPEEIAYLVAEQEERHQRLARAEEALREYIDFRRAWSRKATSKKKKKKNKGKLSLQNQEVSK